MKNAAAQQTAGVPNLYPRFRRIEVCADYRAFVTEFPAHLDAPQYAALVEGLKALGQAEPERLGVTYVRSGWGFMVIPPQGFPELKISFYHATPNALMEQVLQAIREQLDLACIGDRSTGGLTNE